MPSNSVRSNSSSRKSSSPKSNEYVFPFSNAELPSESITRLATEQVVHANNDRVSNLKASRDALLDAIFGSARNENARKTRTKRVDIVPRKVSVPHKYSFSFLPTTHYDLTRVLNPETKKILAKPNRKELYDIKVGDHVIISGHTNPATFMICTLEEIKEKSRDVEGQYTGRLFHFKAARYTPFDSHPNAISTTGEITDVAANPRSINNINTKLGRDYGVLLLKPNLTLKLALKLNVTQERIINHLAKLIIATTDETGRFILPEELVIHIFEYLFAPQPVRTRRRSILGGKPRTLHSKKNFKK